jgi:hypothetical protein
MLPYDCTENERNPVVDGIVPMRFMEAGIDPNEVQRLSLLWVLLRDQIHYRGHRDFIGQIGMFSVQRLATNNDELLLAGDSPAARST